MVATPNLDSFSSAALSARVIFVLTMPRLFMGVLMARSRLLALGLQRGVETREHAPRIAFVDLVALLGRQLGGLDVALGVVVVEAGLRIDAADGADHLRGKQDVVDRDHAGQKVDARLVIHAGVEEDVVEQVILQQRLLQLLGEPAEPAPVIRHGAAAMRDQELEGREVLEQVRGQALHECRGVGIEIMRAGGVEAGVAAGRDVDHRGDVELDHLLIDRIPVPVRQRRRGPVAARRVRVQVDADEAVLLDALLELGNARFRVDARRLRQHGDADEIVREQLADAIAQLVADRRPGRGHLEVADVVGHEARARREHREVAAALLHLLELVALDALAQLVVADLELGGLRHDRRILDARDLPVAPLFQRLWSRRVMAVHVDDHVSLSLKILSRLDAVRRSMRHHGAADILAAGAAARSHGLLYHKGERRDQAGNCDHGEDLAEGQVPRGQFGNQEGAGNTAEAADAHHPGNAGGPPLGRIERRGQRRQRRLRRVHDHAGREHDHHQEAHIAGRLPDQEDRHRRQRIADRDDAVGVEAVHQHAEEHRADAAEREQRRDQGRSLRVEPDVLEQDRHPVDERIEDHQPHEIGDPKHQRAHAQHRRQHHADSGRVDAPGGLGMLRLQHDELADIGGGRRDPAHHLAHALDAGAARQQVMDGLGQDRNQQHGQHQRRDAAEHQHAAPAPLRDHPGGEEAAAGRAQREAAEHQVGHGRAQTARAVLAEQGHGVRHRGAEADAGDAAKHCQLGQVGRERRGETGDAEDQDRTDQHQLAAETVGHGTGEQRAGGKAEQRRAQHRPERRFLDAPLLQQRRRDEADRGGVEAVEQHDDEAEREDQPLEAGERMVVEKGLDVDAGGRGHRFCFLGVLFWLVRRGPQGHIPGEIESCSFGGLTGYVTEGDRPRQRRGASISYSKLEYDFG
ncbi:hypothetical protein BRAO375_4360016 [Bradyrhizobium sp. ORS 375]|nr:hypothetical protein BRAO375_4360016 [Bradyrhizobium sp. ORS 375]